MIHYIARDVIIFVSKHQLNDEALNESRNFN